MLRDFSKALPHTCPNDLCALCQVTGDIMRKHGYTNEEIHTVLGLAPFGSRDDSEEYFTNEHTKTVIFYGALLKKIENE